MNNPLDLKTLEQKAFRSFYQDGIWDIFFGLMMLAMYVPTLFDDMESKGVRTLSLILIELAAVFFLIFGKKAITTPRLGNVNFGEKRKKRLIYIIGVNLFSLGLLLTLMLVRNLNPAAFRSDSADMLSAIGMGVWITFMTSIIAYFLDFKRLYLYAMLYGLTFALVLLFDIPLLFLIAALLILLPGLVIFTRFLQTNKPVTEA